MTVRQYATPEDVAAFTGSGGGIGEPVTVTDEDLQRASTLVDQMLVTAIYDVDDDGLPTDADTLDAIKRATCAQAVWCAENEDLSGSGAVYQTMGLGSASLTRNGAASSSGVTTPRQARYAPEALDILSVAGLAIGAAVTW